VTREAWLERHSYLRPLARFSSEVADALARIEDVRADVPRWEDYDADLRSGVPLLRSLDAGVDFEPAGRMAVELVAKLSKSSSFGGRAADVARLDAELKGTADAPRRVGDWLLGDESLAPSSPGLLRYLGWTAAACYLAPVVGAFDAWRGEDRWLRRYCPTCGSLPAMAQLVGVDQGRRRLLLCGCCATRWAYPRTACPFCERDVDRLGVVTVEGEDGLRLDYCESCRGYLKTCAGQGNEDFFLLADWTSLHLDVLAGDRGLKRMAASLYDVEAVIA
jgi:FdhE protein